MGYGKTDVNTLNVSTDYFKVPNEGTQVFLCPPWNENEKAPYRKWVLHFGVLDQPVACLKEFGQECPMCAANKTLYEMKDNKVAQDISKKIYAKDYFIYNVIPNIDLNKNGNVLFAKDQDPAVKYWTCSFTLHKSICLLSGYFGDFFDPTNGNMILLTKVKSGADDVGRIQPTAHPAKARLDEKLMALVNTKMHDLNTVYKPVSLDKINNALNVLLASVRSGVVYSVPQPQQQVPQTTQPVQNTQPAFSTPQAQQNTSTPVVNVTANTTPPTTTVVTAQLPLTPPQVNTNDQKIDDFQTFLEFKRQLAAAKEAGKQ